MQRVCYLALGHIFVVLSIIGVVLPGMPTTVFLIGAAWAYGKSSKRFHDMIMNHPKYGKLVRNWQDHGIIPPIAKVMAGLMMALSVGICFYEADHWIWPSALAVLLATIYAYIVSRPSHVKRASATS